MEEDSQRFRQRARQCRELAAVASDDDSRRTLAEMAVELDTEADMIEAEERTPDKAGRATTTGNRER